jgi:hypothetical protein
MIFTLNFKSDSYGIKYIDEPFGTAQISFLLKQKTENMARDISVTGGETEFEFTHMRNHELKQLLYYNRKFGFESIVTLTIETDSGYKLIYDLDFANAETDDYEYFKCKGIQDGSFQIIKRRKATKVDVLSDVDIDGNYIGGLVPDNMLLLAKPVAQISEWKKDNLFTKTFSQYGQDVMIVPLATTILKSDIEDTTSPFSEFTYLSPLYTNSQYITAINDNSILKASNKLKDVNIAIKGINLSIVTGGFATSNRISIIYSKTFNPSESTTIKLFESTGDVNLVNQDYFTTIPDLDRDTKVAILVTVFQPYNLPAGSPVSVTSMSFSMSEPLKISVESVAYNSVAKSLRLVDVIRQVVKSISGLSINAQRFEQLGQFYDNRLLDGNFLRGVNDKAFSVSLEDIENSLPEIKGDWEIGSDGKVFFGIEKDYYAQIESGFFDNTQFSEMTKSFNPKYKVNEFRYTYKNYQSLKENEELNSADTIHGESRFAFFNKSVENTKNAEIEWTRDAFLIESTRRKALVIDEKTASQDDNTLFCIDSIVTTFNNTFVETTTLQHSFNNTTFRLKLTNDGSVNFVSLGIQVGSSFKILFGDINAGVYTVFSVLNNVLELTGGGTGTGDGTRSTKYSYELSKEYVPFTNYTNQGFSETENLNASDSYSNRRYSIARNINEYWKSYLATCNLYWKDKVIKNTWYKNNGNYTAKYNGLKLTEKADFVPNNPILSPVLYENVLLANVELEDFVQLQNKIRSERGYIRTIDNNDQVIKIYPVEMEYLLLEKELNIKKAEEKFEPTSMSISTEFNYVLINNETRVSSLLWEIKNEKLYIFDENRYRLYNGVYWMEVSINGAFANNIEQLEEWLSLVN